MPSLSIVSAVYNTGNMVPELVNRIKQTVSQITGTFEIILVDDGSSDSSWETLESIAHEQSNITAIKLSRNFGQHAAIAAGLNHSTGDWVVVMDSDLEDLPEAIIPLYQEINKGYSVVFASRQSRTDSFFRQLSSKAFYRLFSWLADSPADHSIANFGIYSRQVIDEIVKMKEYHLFFPTMVSWVGFKKSAIQYEHGKRQAGTSGYNFRKLTRLGINIILSYSDKPLRYVVKLGFVISLLTFLCGIIILIRYFMGHIMVLGYTSLILSIWFLGGLILFTIGIAGLYTGKIFEQVKNRPLFIIEKLTTG
ncbi:MAG TPA: glycosyltransferase family 2 protein [Chitinophagaceae bacterium]|nr:glycosyltransferase family 2 protein [Chitinophagaceae bacterium]